MSFKFKTILGIAFIETILLAIIVWKSMSFLVTSNKDLMMQKANTTVNLSESINKDALIAYDLASLDSFIQEILKNKDVMYVRILDGEGEVLSKGGNQVLLEKNYIKDNDIHFDQDLSYDIHTYFEVEGEKFGKIEMGFSIEEMKKQIVRARSQIVFIAVFEIILSGIFSYFLGSVLTKRLAELNKASNELGLGNYDVSVSVAGNDEINQVASTFNKMAINLKDSATKQREYQKQLEEMNLNLERKVEERTDQLNLMYESAKKTNMQLNHEKQEQVKLIKQLELTRNQLIHSEKMASVGQLSAGIAHEINNPVGFIKSNVEMLRDSLDDMMEMIKLYDSMAEKLDLEDQETIREKKSSLNLDFLIEDVYELLSETEDGTKRVSTIVNDLKEYSHFGDKEISSNHLKDGVESTLKIIKNEIKDRIDVKVDLDTIPEVQCCMSEINQVFMNMFINASHAIEDKGVIEVSGCVKGEVIEVRISDNGSGISKDNQLKIFDPFFTTKPVGTGTGLGLSLSYSIIKNHGGNLSVESELGRGTTFIIELPLKV